MTMIIFDKDHNDDDDEVDWPRGLWDVQLIGLSKMTYIK